MMEDAHLGRRLSNTTSSKLLHTSTRLECVMRCSANRSCLSINFCQDSLCEHIDDVFSTADMRENALIADSNCVFINMQVGYSMNCTIGGKAVGIQNDTTSQEKCAMKQPCGVECSDEIVSDTQIDNAYEWKVVETRDDGSEVILHWLIFVHEPRKNFYDAKKLL